MKKYYIVMQVRQGIFRKFRVTWDYLPVTTNTFGNTDADDTYVWVKPYGSPESERFTIEKSLLIEE
jgi:hypothetical protein